MKQIELLYINKKNTNRLQEWYDLLNIRGILTEKQLARLAELDEEFQCKALLFNDKPQSQLVENEAIKNEIIMAFSYVCNYHRIDEIEKIYLDKRFKYMKDIAQTVIDRHVHKPQE